MEAEKLARAASIVSSAHGCRKTSLFRKSRHSLSISFFAPKLEAELKEWFLSKRTI
jgi:hypothetical protein